MGKAKKVGVSNPTKPVDNSNLTSFSKTIKANTFRHLKGYECKKILREKVKGLKNKDDDVLLPPLEKLSEKHMATMSYKDKGKLSDTFRLFGESHDSSHVSSIPILPSWAIQLKKEVEESRRMIEASQMKIEDLNAKIVVQDEKIKELERKATTTKHYVRSSHRTTFLSGTSG